MCSIFSNISFSHDSDVHKYIVWNAWQVVKDQHAGYNYSAMDNRIGTWWEGFYNTSNSWTKGYVVSGAWLEDEDDVVYHYSIMGTPTMTHFWDPANTNCDLNPDNTKIEIENYCYENVYRKTQAYWNGKKYAGEDWLHLISMPVVSGPNLPGAGNYTLFLRYDDLSNVYKYNQIYVTSAWKSALEHYDYNPPRPLMDFNLQGGTRAKIETICWEIVGRMCHLLGDQSVPAHTHNDPHACGVPWMGCDTYEQFYMAPPYNHYLDYDYHDALEQGIPYGGLPIVTWNGSQPPFRFLLYTTNQLADRFPSNDEDGDYYYDLYGPNGEPHSDVISPIMSTINVSFTEQSYETFEECASKVYPFAMRTTAGLLKYVYDKFGIVSTPPPLISSLSQSPAMLCPSSYSYITCNLSQGGGINYTWTSIDLPSNITVTPIGDGRIVRLYKAPTMGSGDMPPAPICQLICTASNQYGTDRDTILIAHASICNAGGCPWIYVYNSDSGSFVQDNNILHRSEFSEFAGSNINDLYKLQVKPTFFDNKAAIMIKETESDTNYYNTVKLLAVDHPVGTKIGITENNHIVMFDNDNVQSTDGASLNNFQNITNLIQYYYQGKKIVNGEIGDNIYAHYDSTEQMKMFMNFNERYGKLSSIGTFDSIALIGEIGENDRVIHGNVAKDYAGLINIFTENDNYTKLFARREANSTVIIPFTNNADAVDHIDVNWNRDYQVSYFSVVPIVYSGFSVTEMPIVEAKHTLNGDCIVDLSIDDTNFVKLDSSGAISIFYENIVEPNEGLIRDYVININGRYSSSTSSTNSQLRYYQNNSITNKLGTSPLEYKLYLNYPNPFNPKTVIKYDIAKNGNVRLVVYDLLGREITELVNKFVIAGTYSVEFDGTNLASGLYIYKIISGDFVEIKKMVLLK